MPLLPIVPELVSDETLKRARTTVTDGGEEKDAIRVTSVGGSSGTDLSPVTDRIGDVNGGTWFPIDPGHAPLLDIQRGISKALMLPTGSSTVYTLLDELNNDKMIDLITYTSDIKNSTDDIKNATDSVVDVTGTQSDAAWSGTGDGTVIALLKGIFNIL